MAIEKEIFLKNPNDKLIKEAFSKNSLKFIKDFSECNKRTTKNHAERFLRLKDLFIYSSNN